MAALAAGALGAGIVFAASQAFDGETLPPTTTIVSTRSVIEPTALLDAWERSRVGPYAIDGIIERTRSGQIERSSVHHARTADRAIEQMGRTALVTDPSGQRSCEILESGEVGCAAPTPAPTPAQERAVLAAVVGPGGTHDVYPGQEAGCFQLIARTAVTGSLYGLSTVICFDETTGATTGYTTIQGPESATSFRATSLTSEVTDLDLEPRLRS